MFVRRNKHSLKSLKFHSDISTNHIIELASLCPFLERLDLSYHRNIRDKDFKRILKALGKNLKVINIEACNNLGAKSIRHISEHCPKLTKIYSNIELRSQLWIDFCQKTSFLEEMHINFDRIDNLSPLIESIAQSCKNFKHFESVTLAPVVTNLNDLQTLCLKIPSLKSITVTELNNDSLVEVSKKLTHLDEITFRDCRDITEKGFENFCEQVKDIKSLSLSHLDFDVSDKAINDLAENSPELSSLELSYCRKISEETLIKLTEKFPKIQSLSFSGHTKLSSKLLDTMKSTLKHLENLNLKYLDLNTEEGIPFFIPSPELQNIAHFFPDLKHLDLSKQKNIDDDIIITLAKSCPKLRHLDLSYCTKITEKSLFALAEHCRNLKTIHLTTCTNISEKGFIEFIKASRHLEHLDISGTKAKDSTINTLSEHSKKLLSLKISENPSVTESAVYNLVEKCSRIIFIDATQSFGLSPRLATFPGVHVEANIHITQALAGAVLEEIFHVGVLEIAPMFGPIGPEP